MEFGLKLKCMPFFFTFEHHLTTPLGLQKFALSVVIGLKTQIYAALEATMCKMAHFTRNAVGSDDLIIVLRRAILGDLERAGNLHR